MPTLNEVGGDWEAFLCGCYSLYEKDFLSSRPSWPGKRFSIKRHPEVDGQCRTFWHIITEGDDEENRTPTLPRCERVGWPRAILDEFNRVHPARSSQRICWWVEKRGNEDRYHIALADFSYMVVVADRKDYVLLWTAFPIDREVQRAKRREKFASYWLGKTEAAPKDGLVTPSTAGR